MPIALDLLIRIGKRLDSSLISDRLGTTRRVTVASTSYFEQRGEPKTPEDLLLIKIYLFLLKST